jgi:hypothetical protein
VLQILDEFLLLLDHLGRDAEDAGAQAPVGPRAVQSVELLGGLFEALRERGDELVSIGQLGLERLDSILRHFCFDHPDATVARVVPVCSARFPSRAASPPLPKFSSGERSGRTSAHPACGKKATD